jgi:hypothetical protein
MWFAVLLAASQPLPTTCAGVMGELKMRPPAYGERTRAEYAWNLYLRNCEQEWKGLLSAEDVIEILRLIQGR